MWIYAHWTDTSVWLISTIGTAAVSYCRKYILLRGGRLRRDSGYGLWAWGSLLPLQDSGCSFLKWWRWKRQLLRFPPVLVFCSSVTENSGAHALSQGVYYRPRYYISLAAWPTSLATGLISPTAPSLLFGLPPCIQILTALLGLLYIVLSFPLL